MIMPAPLAPNSSPPHGQGEPAALAGDVHADDLQAMAEQRSNGVGASLEDLWADLLGIASDHLRLVSLEAQRTGLDLAQMVIDGMVTSLLLAVSWIALTGAVTLWLIEGGLPPSVAWLIAAALNLAGAFGLVRLTRHRGRPSKRPKSVAFAGRQEDQPQSGAQTT